MGLAQVIQWRNCTVFSDLVQKQGMTIVMNTKITEHIIKTIAKNYENRYIINRDHMKYDNGYKHDKYLSPKFSNSAQAYSFLPQLH